MTSDEYREAIQSLGLSQHRAAKWLGISPRTSQGYALGERRIPGPVERLLLKEIELRECSPPRRLAGVLG